MKKALVVIAVIFATVLGIASCGKDPVPAAPVVQQVPVPSTQAVAPQAAPVVIQQAPVQSHSGLNDILLGGVIGHMIGSSGSRAPAPAPVPAQTTVVKKVTNVTNVTNVTRVAPPAPATVRPSYTPTPSYRPAPSYSGSTSYRSSYSGSSFSSRR